MHVLLVEDDCVSAEILSNSLRHFGYDVTVSDNGREAFELIRTGKYRLVVSDWDLPEMSGVEICRQISTPLISGRSQSETTSRYLPVRISSKASRPLSDTVTS